MLLGNGSGFWMFWWLDVFLISWNTFLCTFESSVGIFYWYKKTVFVDVQKHWSWSWSWCSVCVWCLCLGVSQVVYFTALFPYVILLILLVNNMLLPGATQGILFYLTPKWHKLREIQVTFNRGGHPDIHLPHAFVIHYLLHQLTF